MEVQSACTSISLESRRSMGWHKGRNEKEQETKTKKREHLKRQP
jgi:hypothetical protein